MRPATLALAAGGLLGGAAVAAVAGARRWRRATARAVARLDASTGGAPPAAPDPGALDGLPAPVARYARFAVTPGRGAARRMRVEHAGTFAARPGRWAPFTSVQHVAVDPPGFVWDAVIRMAPGLPVRVRDRYLAGEGAMAASVGGLVPMVDQKGTPELAAGALMRYLAEAAWLPSALFSRGVAWTPVDDSTVRVTLTDGGVTVALDVGFGPRGEILRVSGDRYRDVGGRGVLTPWEGHFSDYALRDGFVIPLAGEVAWLLPEGRYPYWRGRVVGVTYDVPRDVPRDDPRPPRPMTPSLGRPAARTAGLLAAAYGVYVAATWARYGHPRRAHATSPGDLLDRFMPAYEVGERSRLRVAAPVEATMAAARALDLGRLPVARALFRTRAWLLGACAEPLTPAREPAAATQAMGWGVLADEPRALVMGTVCHPWEADPGFQPVAPAHFAAFDEPGFVRIAWAVGAEPDGHGGSVAWTETRVATTDAAARARFRPYWAVLSPGILLIRWAALRLVRREAERAARPVPAF